MRPGAGPAIRATALSKCYGSTRALAAVDLEVGAGTVLALLGPNGAGKSTTVRILTTLTAPDSGRAEVAGYDVIRQAHLVRASIGLAGQHAAVDGRLTGRENLIMVGRLHRLSHREARRRAAELLERFDLVPVADRPAHSYSGGTRRRIDLAASLVSRAPVLFLDEPTTGLDPRSRSDLWDLVDELVGNGTAVLLTTQYLDEADRLADHITVVDHGRVVAEGSPEELKRSIGSERLSVRVHELEQLFTVSEAMRRIGGHTAVADPVAREVTTCTPDGARLLTEVIHGLDGTGIVLDGAELLRPSLDDVFLALTLRGGSE
ncbi:ATP-binding cassette domain-containing protein [Streptacidiphilus sp. N1-10]|uniref:ATP-binding cassette domain-containing protein n=1 Tax=Streptacidiphilus jeojiensis TaxID=3229225 RepID=A0ABV6XR21_9ACTN